MMALEKIVYTAHTTATGGREGVAKSDDGTLDVMFSGAAPILKETSRVAKQVHIEQGPAPSTEAPAASFKRACADQVLTPA